MVQDVPSPTNTRTPAEIRLAQAAAILHGTCLLLAGLMLLAAAGGPDPLLTTTHGQLAASVDLPLGGALLVAAGYLGRRTRPGIRILATLEAIALVTSPLLTLPLLILMGMAMSGVVASTMVSRRPAPTVSPTDPVSGSIRVAQILGLLHGLCLVIAAGALLGAASDATPLISRSDAAIDLDVNGTLGAVIAVASLYLARRPGFGRGLLALAEVSAFVVSVFLRIPLLVGLDIFLSVAVETSLVIARRTAPRAHSSSTAAPWPKMPLPWVGVTVLVAFFGFAAGGYITTEQNSPNAPLLWVGGVVGAVISGAATAGLGYWVALRSDRAQGTGHQTYL